MDFSTALTITGILIILAAFFLGSRIFFPFHRILAIIIYLLSWPTFIYSLYLRKRWLSEQADLATAIFRIYRAYFLIGIGLIIGAYILYRIIPWRRSPLAKLSPKELKMQLAQDIDTVSYLDKVMDEKVNELTATINTIEDHSPISKKTRRVLDDGWYHFVESAFELDLLSKRHQGFYRFKIISKPVEHSKSFLIGYFAFLSQYRHTMMLTKVAGDHRTVTNIFNHRSPRHTIPKDVYFRLKRQLTRTKEILRLQAGRGYLRLIKKYLKEEPELLKRVTTQLRDIDSSIGMYPKLLIKNPLDFLEKKSFALWFPLQKNIALQLSYIHASNHKHLISLKQIRDFRKKLKPGDIFLERRSWHATNIGIPGFWTHTAFFIGTLAEMDEYFKGLPELEGKPLSEYIKRNQPELFKKLNKPDKKGFPMAVVESKRPGVILDSLESNAAADSIAALRPRTTKDQKLKAILSALSQVGKPYDYTFDFLNNDALVCSEIVYKAYNENGISFKTETIAGRLFMSTNYMAQKFDEEYDTDNQELDLVIFLDGSERKKKAFEGSTAKFRKTWQRPKWYILEEYGLI